MDDNGCCTICAHSYESHQNVTEFIRGRTESYEVPAMEIINKYSSEGQSVEKALDGIVAKIETLNAEMQVNIDKSIEYSNYLETFALTPVGVTKLNYIEELLRIENFKPIMKKCSKRIDMLKKMKQDEQSLNNLVNGKSLNPLADFEQ